MNTIKCKSVYVATNMVRKDHHQGLLTFPALRGIQNTTIQLTPGNIGTCNKEMTLPRFATRPPSVKSVPFGMSVGAARLHVPTAPKSGWDSWEKARRCSVKQDQERRKQRAEEANEATQGEQRRSNAKRLEERVRHKLREEVATCCRQKGLEHHVMSAVVEEVLTMAQASEGFPEDCGCQMKSCAYRISSSFSSGCRKRGALKDMVKMWMSMAVKTIIDTGKITPALLCKRRVTQISLAGLRLTDTQAQALAAQLSSAHEWDEILWADGAIIKAWVAQAVQALQQHDAFSPPSCSEQLGAMLKHSQQWHWLSSGQAHSLGDELTAAHHPCEIFQAFFRDETTHQIHSRVLPWALDALQAVQDKHCPLFTGVEVQKQVQGKLQREVSSRFGKMAAPHARVADKDGRRVLNEGQITEVSEQMASTHSIFEVLRV